MLVFRKKHLDSYQTSSAEGLCDDYDDDHDDDNDDGEDDDGGNDDASHGRNKR